MGEVLPALLTGVGAEGPEEAVECCCYYNLMVGGLRMGMMIRLARLARLARSVRSSSHSASVMLIDEEAWVS